MFGFNWTRACPGGDGEPPPGHYRLFGLTVIAFIVVYGLVALPFLWVARPYDESWPILLLPATPFVCVLGVWKFIVWFGLKRTMIAALAVTTALTLSHPFWTWSLLKVQPVATPDDWARALVVMVGLAGWLMVAAALVIGPVRLLLGWLRRRDAKSCVVPPKQGGS